MFSIGALSKQTGVKVPTIRYYEQIGLIDPTDRTEGNQRRYSDEAIQRLGFIKHARELGFSIEGFQNISGSRFQYIDPKYLFLVE